MWSLIAEFSIFSRSWGRWCDAEAYRPNVTPDRMYPERVMFECGPPLVGPVTSGVSSAHPGNQIRDAIANNVVSSPAFRRLIIGRRYPSARDNSTLLT